MITVPNEWYTTACVSRKHTLKKPKTLMKKSIETKATALAPVATTAPVAPVANAAKSNKLYDFDQCIALMKKCNIGYKNDTRNYRIFNGGSSLNVKKSRFIIYTNDVDFDNVISAKIDGVTTIKNGNTTDKSRSHVVECTSNAILEKLLKVYALNTANAPH